jgi:hypothetical protein
MSLVGDHALIGLSRVRERHIFGDLPLLARRASPLCGVALVNLVSGRTAGFFEMSGPVTEVFDVRFLPGLSRVNILRSDSEECRAAVATRDVRFWLRPENES